MVGMDSSTCVERERELVETSEWKEKSERENGEEPKFGELVLGDLALFHGAGTGEG